ncbi:MAG: S41 family peptidase [Marinobacterium sp.]|nr:S41 family peptidase [Marinobacterium sp.]
MKKTGLCCLVALLLSGCQVESTDNSPTTQPPTTGNNTTGNNTSGTNTGGGTVDPAPACSLVDQHQQFAQLFTLPQQSQSGSSSTGIYYEIGTATPPTDVTSPTQSLKSLMLDVRSITDRWSFVREASLDKDLYAALHQSLGARWELVEDASSTANAPVFRQELRVLYVYPGSPAYNAGLRRGMTVTHINGLQIPLYTPSTQTPDPQQDIFDAQLAALLEGNQVQLTTLGGLMTAVRPAVAQSYSPIEFPLNATAPYTLSDGRKVGYFYLDAFYASESNYVWAFNRLRQQGVTELIIDLRNNSGGRVVDAHLLAQLIVGSSRDGMVFNSLEFNAYHTSKNEQQTFNLSSFSNDVQNVALHFNQIVFLTSGKTASSSELLINGLRPYINTVVIGDNTAGKPYGMMPVDICGNIAYPISFINLNANHQPIPTSGLPTTRGCEIPDIPDVNRPLGYIGDINNSNDGEPLLERALNYLDKGGCFAF